MALSKEEQGLLDDIEAGLREDPSFTAGLDTDRVRRRRGRRVIALTVPGMLLLVLGEMLALTEVIAGVALSVCGFLAMLMAVAWSSGRWDHRWSRLRSRRTRRSVHGGGPG